MKHQTKLKILKWIERLLFGTNLPESKPSSEAKIEPITLINTITFPVDFEKNDLWKEVAAIRAFVNSLSRYPEIFTIEKEFVSLYPMYESGPMVIYKVSLKVLPKSDTNGRINNPDLSGKTDRRYFS